MTGENFVEKALAFMRASGRSDGEHPVVRRDSNAMAFWAWIAFWRQIGRPTAFAERSGVLTVPAEWPWDFSADADHLHDADLVPIVPRDKGCSPEQRAQIGRLFAGLRVGGGHEPRARSPRNSRMRSRYDEAREAYTPQRVVL